MPLLSYTNSAFQTLTKISSSVMNQYFADIKTFLNTTRLDTTNLQSNGVLSSNIGSGAATSQQLLTADGSGGSAFTSVDYEGYLNNLSISAAVSSNNLTVSVKTKAGIDATSTTAIGASFRNSSATSGTYVTRSITAALSLTVPSGATLGHISAASEYVYIHLLDNGGTVELAVSGGRIYDENYIASSTTISSGATSRNTLYSTAGRSNVGVRYIGKIAITEATAGTWTTAPTKLALVSLSGQNTSGISCRYTNTNHQSISNVTETVLTGWTLDYDTNNAFNASTGLFTAPVEGRYQVSAMFLWEQSAWSAAGNSTLSLQKNATPSTQILGLTASALMTANSVSVNGVGTIYLAAGDTLGLAIYVSDGNGHAVNNAAGYNWITINKIP